MELKEKKVKKNEFGRFVTQIKIYWHRDKTKLVFFFVGAREKHSHSQ